MATKVHMEALSPTMEEGRLVTWLKKEGDAVTEGDVLAEIETDKATMELVARGSGVMRAQTLAEGASAPVGTVIAMIAGADEKIDDATGAAGAAPQGEGAEGQKPDTATATPTEEKPVPASDAAPAPAAPAPVVETPATRASQPAPQSPAPAENGGARVKASPLARKMAAESGVELRSVQGSGPGGRITKRDIEGAATQPAATPAARTTGAAPRAASDADYEDIPLTQMRKTIAKRLATSIGPVPTFYLTIEVDMTAMQRARENVNKRLEESGTKTSINDFIIKAVAAALRQHPEVNAQWTDTAIRRFNRVHIGVAVAVEDGLITPIIRDADTIGVAAISQQVRELAKRARERKLQPDEYTGATFSISNLGMFGIDEFTAIINPPEAAILAIGRVEEKVVVENGEMVVQPRMRVTMSCDHRVIDGATGAKFLQTLRQYLEEPAMMLV
ncbi:MAG TPA: pyruvate dehydrogenase complex dihydrolipoamide acetyltransferase [Longimicrobiales bacterium]|nr:pyruvate dehydrogenase complex dihydrolipoamide acetyltransferase [Longimicrobiales bacterium]